MFIRSNLPLAETGFFTPFVLDYVSGKDGLKEFYSYSPDENSLPAAVGAKQMQKLNRDLLKNVLEMLVSWSGAPCRSQLGAPRVELGTTSR